MTFLVDDGVREAVIKAIRDGAEKTVEEVYGRVREEHEVTREGLADLMMQLEREGELEFEEPPLRPGSFAAYLLTPSRSLWLYLLMAFSIASVFVILILPGGGFLDLLRIAMGSALLFFLPGYSTIRLLFFGKKGLNRIETFALGIGASLALTPLIALLLNFTPDGIRVGQVTLSLSTYSVLVALLAQYQEYRAERRSVEA